MKRILLIIAMTGLCRIATAQTLCDKLLQDGKNAYSAGNYTKAKECFNNGLKPGYRCNTADFKEWLKKCNAKLATPKQPDAKQIQCEQRYKDGKEAFDKGDYETALLFFKKGLEENCTNVDFADYIEMCNMKIEKRESMISDKDGDGVPDKDDRCPDQAGPKANKGCPDKDGEGVPDSDDECPDQAGPKETRGCPDKDGDGIPDKDDKCPDKAGPKETGGCPDKDGDGISEDTDIFSMMRKAVNINPIYSYDNGKYKGQMANGTCNGLGVYYWNDSGDFYFGRWKVGNMDVGIYIVMDNNEHLSNCLGCKYYVGGWSSGNKSGFGTCYDETGELIYHGDFTADKPTETYPNPDADDYSACRFEVLNYTNDKYIGETIDGKADGYGIYLWKNGYMWYGPWKNGERNGYGIEIKYDGSLLTGTWKGDVRTE